MESREESAAAPQQQMTHSALGPQGQESSRDAEIAFSSIPAASAPDPGAEDWQRTFATLPELARRIVRADFAAVTVMNRHGQVEHMFYAGLDPSEAEQIGVPPRGVGVLGRLGPASAPLRLDHIRQHEASVGFPQHHPPMDALLGVHVVAAGGRRANLYVANAPEHPAFTDEDEKALGALAAYARLGLESLQLYQQEADQRRHAEDAERRLASVIQGSSAGVLIVRSMDGSVAYASREAERLLGVSLPAGALAFNHLKAVEFLREDGTRVAPDALPLRGALNNGTPAGPVEMIFHRPDGTRVPVLVSASPIMDANQRVNSAIAVFQDATSLKELDQLKTDFLSMVTHDLRTPISTIKGLVSAARDWATPSGELATYLEMMDEEADQMNELISNLLDMSRIAGGAAWLDQESCHIADIVQDAVQRASRSRAGQGRRIVYDVPSGLPQIFADPRQIGRVLDNLLSNALKYSDDEVSVTAEYRPESGELVTRVSDQGEGIPAGYQDDVFDKFFRVRGNSTESKGGAGLGLAICKAIVELHNGRIGVISAEHRGSTFWFVLPAAEAPARSADEAAGEEESA